MSMDSAGIFCTGCAYESREVYQPIGIRYLRDDGKTVETGRTKGWCYRCDSYADIEKIDRESLLDVLNGLVKQTIELKQKLAELETGIFAKFFNRYQRQNVAWQLEQLVEKQAETELLLAFFAKRVSKPRCLKCFSEQTVPITFNAENYLSDNFRHHCGGQLRITHDDIGLRINFRRKVLVLSAEGEFIKQD